MTKRRMSIQREPPVTFFFGNDSEEDDMEKREMHPLQRARNFFHYPWQELSFTVDIPEAGQAWKKFFICIDLTADWPRKLSINKDVFRLHTVPLENISRESTTPIVFEGTKERYLIRHPDPEQGFELQTILGVYKIMDGGMVPLKPGILSGGESTYEIAQKMDPAKGSRFWLCLHDSSAFENPVTLVLDGLWHQPEFSQQLSEMLKARPYSRNISGVRWDLCEGMVKAQHNRFQDNMDEYMHLLTIRNKSVLDFEDISALLQMIGPGHQENFKPVNDLFYGVHIEQAPISGGLLRHIYHLKYKACEPGMVPLAKIFTEKVGLVLNAWVSEAVVEARMEIDTA